MCCMLCSLSEHSEPMLATWWILIHLSVLTLQAGVTGFPLSILWPLIYSFTLFIILYCNYLFFSLVHHFSLISGHNVSTKCMLNWYLLNKRDHDCLDTTWSNYEIYQNSVLIWKGNINLKLKNPLNPVIYLLHSFLQLYTNLSYYSSVLSCGVFVLTI